MKLLILNLLLILCLAQDEQPPADYSPDTYDIIEEDEEQLVFVFGNNGVMGPPDGLMMMPPGELLGQEYTEEIIGENSQGERFYQKKVVQEGPGFVHVTVVQAGNPGAIPIDEGASPEAGFLNMMAQMMEIIHKQHLQALMDQVVETGSSLFQPSNTSLMPYQGFLSEEESERRNLEESAEDSNEE